MATSATPEPAPNMPLELPAAAKLPLEVAPTQVFFFGHVGDAGLARLHQRRRIHFSDPAFNQRYTTSEHCMMSNKAELFDKEVAAGTTVAATPAEAKRMGRQAEVLRQEVWDRE